MNKRGILVFILMIGIGVLVGVGVMVGRSHARIAEDAVRHGLTVCYAAAATESEEFITPEQMKNVIQSDLRAPLEKSHLLPSFVKSENVYFSVAPVAKGSSKIVCAIKLGESRYLALNGNGDCMMLDQAGIDGWDHAQ
jgi:hypothetical protein